MAKPYAAINRDTGHIVGWYDGSGKLHRCKAKNPIDCAKEAGMAIVALERGELPEGKTYGACRVGSTPGVCLEHGPAPPGKKWVRGKCPGAANIQCLVDKSAKNTGGGRRPTTSPDSPPVAAEKSKLPTWWPYAAAGATGLGIVGWLFASA